MVYYRSMRGFRAAINRRVKIWCYRDDSMLSGYIEILHKDTEAKFMAKIADIMKRVHDYKVETVYLAHGFNSTKITVNKLSELDGPIPNEFLTN